MSGKREVVVLPQRFETIDLTGIDGPALCLRKKHLEETIRTAVDEDQLFFARREIRRVDAELARRKDARRREAKGPVAVSEHLAFLHAVLRAAKRDLAPEAFKHLMASAQELAASGSVTCARCAQEGR